MDEWRVGKLADVCESIDYGFTASAIDHPIGPKFLRITDIVQSALNWREVPYVQASESDANKFKLYDGDIVIARTGATTGESRFIRNPPNAVFASYLVRLRINRKNDARFISYWLKSPAFRGFLQGVLGDKSAQPNASASTMTQAPIRIPAKSETQREIAAILGALDDKIELNRRMNETLESMARAIFKDWFVDFGPTRAKAEGREPYLAPELWHLFPDALNDKDKPVGWATIPLKQLGRVVTGKTPSTKNPAFFGGDIPFLKIPDMRGRVYVLRTSTSLSEEGAKSQIQKTLPAGSVSVSCIATPGLVTLNHQDTQTNQQINTIIPSDRRQSHFVFWSCRLLAAAVMRGGSGGSVFRNMNKSSFENLQVVYPGKEVARTYSKTVAHIHSRMLLNEYESDSLAQTRDLLLPKLMSGEIRLSNAERAVEAVA
ncbi:MAG: restriction endonuclease subunit S [Rhodospirillaceae bacterium]|nr:restriction endonuclease subunit S [Rhodospirillaceae bacterium]